jgi:hypothetical protein
VNIYLCSVKENYLNVIWNLLIKFSRKDDSERWSLVLAKGLT